MKSRRLRGEWAGCPLSPARLPAPGRDARGRGPMKRDLDIPPVPGPI